MMIAYSIHSTVAELETLNNGKPVKVARDLDIGDSVQCLRYYAGTSRRLTIWKHHTDMHLPLKTGWADKILGEVRNSRTLLTRADLGARQSRWTIRQNWHSRDTTPSGSVVRCKLWGTEILKFTDARYLKHSLELPHHDVVSGLRHARG